MAELLLPVPMIVFAMGVFDVTFDISTGLTVVQVSVTSQLLAPEEMVQDGDAGLSVPDIGGALAAVTVIVASFETVPLDPFLTAMRYTPLCHPCVTKLTAPALLESS